MGSMVWGEQNTESEAHAQLDCGMELGVNFIDTAEMYAVPSKQETFGASELIIGNWMRRRANRQQMVIATKVCGPCGDWMPYIRNGKTRLDQQNINTAIEGSLKRLQTDYIDLYQLHWPQRKTNYFGQLGYTHEDTPDWISIEETLEVLDRLVKQGKIRAIGVSNETSWGLMRFVSVAKQLGLSKVTCIQNPYNLLNRTFEVGLAEICMREHISLIPYSPLGFGVLTGKYLDDGGPSEARLNQPRFKRFTRYTNPLPKKATELYAQIAADQHINFTQMSLAYVNSRPFVASTIIGTSSVEQVQENIASLNLSLDDDVLKAIEQVHKQHPSPAP